jgi:hypothetical protein
MMNHHTIGHRLARRVRQTALAGAIALGAGWLPAAWAQQKGFSSPEAALQAFGDAVTTSDEDGLKAIFGPDVRKFVPPVGAEYRYRFLEAWAKGHGLKREGDAKALVTVGTDGWTFPFPIVKTAQGWRFDRAAGIDEMRVRRIGRNEHAVGQVMLAIFDAQKDYAAVDRNGDGVLEYAGKTRSSPGRKDGLYWPAKAGEPESPLGPALAEAVAAGGSAEVGYYGYRYRILHAQGSHAPGGAYDYRVRGRMIGGFAAVAWPVKYGETGVMTFVVSHDGVVYEKDLGPDTEARAKAMTRFDPGPGWIRFNPAQ